MITYEKFCQIKSLAQTEGFSAAQIARHTGINEKTVRRWLAMSGYQQRPGVKRPSKLNPFKSVIKRWLEQADFTAIQICQKLRTAGYTGGKSLVSDYVASMRPSRHRAYRTLTFAPGDVAQVDWGTYESVQVGSSRRKLSFLTVVLGYSRMLYVEFFLQERMEHFLAGLQNAFLYFGTVPRTLMVDNLKCAVFEHRPGLEPVFNARFIDFVSHYGSSAFACNPRRPNEKGQVESGVKYVKGNFLNGMDLSQLPNIDPQGAINGQARGWMENIANVREHWELKKRPIDLYNTDQVAMLPLNLVPYDNGITISARVSKRCRVIYDTNRYSVPPRFASRKVNVHAYHDRICIYYQGELIAAHVRSYDRNQQIVDQDHQTELDLEFNRGKQADTLVKFQELDEAAPAFLAQLRNTRFGFLHHVRKILALVEIHGRQAVVEAMHLAIQAEAYSAESILNLIDRRARQAEGKDFVGTISATAQSRALLDIRLPPPNLGQYQFK
jgi:transposase